MVRFWVITALLSTTACQDASLSPENSLGDSYGVAEAETAQTKNGPKFAPTNPAPIDPVAITQAELEAAHCADVNDPKFDPDVCLSEPEFRPVKFAGHWRVINVFVGDIGVAAFDRDDPAIVGASFDISLKHFKWRDEKRDFDNDDVCKGPTIGPVDKSAENEFGTLALDALKAWRISGSARGAMYRTSCVSSGNWGPSEQRGEMVIVPIGSDRMAMQWYDDTVLLAQRDHGGK
jgi:hypothetical protein